MTIRRLSVTDLPGLARLHSPFAMSLDWELALPRSLDLLPWRSLLPYHVSGACTLVFRRAGQSAAVQAEARPGPDKCTILRLGLAPQADPAILVPLLEALCVPMPWITGRAASSPRWPATTASASSAGWTSWPTPTRPSTAWCARRPARRRSPARRPPSPCAPCAPGTSGGCTPCTRRSRRGPVQLLEGLTSDDWEFRLPHRVAWPGLASEVRLVLEAEAGVSGYLTLTRGRRGHRMEMMVHPRQRELAGPLLQAGLDVAAHWPPLPVYCGLRGYQAELGQVLESAGFQPMGAQTLHGEADGRARAAAPARLRAGAGAPPGAGGHARARGACRGEACLALTGDSRRALR